MPGATVCRPVLSWLGLRVGTRLGLFTAADLQFVEERDRLKNDRKLQISRFECDAHHRMALAELLRISRLSQRTGTL